MEGVNDLTVNQASIHTASGCHISDSEAANGATGTLVGGSDCASAESNNGGCGQQATSLSNTYGPSFNNNSGGVYASTNSTIVLKTYLTRVLQCSGMNLGLPFTFSNGNKFRTIFHFKPLNLKIGVYHLLVGLH